MDGVLRWLKMSEGIINCFPEYELVIDSNNKVHNMYRGEDLGLGGWVMTKPGMYGPTALLDVASLHPSSIILMNKLGDYTKNYADLRNARVFIKHKDYDSVKKLFNGKLAKYLESEEEADTLSTALKLPINAFYGVGTAKFENPAKDSRDINNIVALRGALFMKTLVDAVEEQGFNVIHVKTDSLKIENPTDEIIKFAQDFAKKYGYELEHECTYERICLINKACYIAKYDDKGIRNKGGKHANEWTATAAEFAHPYIFKTCFTHEKIEFSDYCETKSVKGKLYLDMNDGLPDVTYWERIKENRKRDASKLTKKAVAEIFDTRDMTDEQIDAEIAKGHNYIFIGRISQFVPVVDEAHGGELVVKRDGKFSAVAGTKGYRWLEATAVKSLGLEDLIDKSYYRKLVDDAIEDISVHGDYNWFANAPVGSRMNDSEEIEWIHEIINDPDIPF